jgi:phage-related baseplate assembly protein
MPLTLEQVRTIITRDEALDELITVLQSLGFNTTAWQTGGVRLTLLTGCAEVWAQMSTVASALSYFHFNDDATSTSLTALSSSHYDNTRVAATRTVGDVDLIGAAVGPPHVVAIGDLVVADNINGYTYRNITGGVVPASGTLTLSWQAEVAGEDRNVADSTIDILQTPLAGVTCNNPGPSWRTTDAVDEETDAVLRLRNSTRWSTLSYATSAGAYEQFALAADSTVARVFVYDTVASTGVLSVFIASSSGALGAGVVTTVQTAIDLQKPLTADVTVISVTEVAQNFTAEIFVTASLNNAAKQAEIEAALDTYINGLPIGGTVLPAGAPQGYMLFSEVNEAISSITGVENITWTTPTADVAITSATATVANVMTVGAVTFTYTDI